MSRTLVKFPNLGMTLEAAGLKLPRTMEFDTWAAAGRVLGQHYRGVQWAVGDWVNFGEERFGEQASQHLDGLGFDEGYLSNLGYVAGRFQPARRRAALPWSMHQAVAGLAPQEADKWLGLAEAKKWDREEFRAALKEAGAIKGRKEVQQQEALPGTRDPDAEWWPVAVRSAGERADVIDRATRRAMERYGVQTRIDVVARWAAEYLAGEREPAATS